MPAQRRAVPLVLVLTLLACGGGGGGTGSESGSSEGTTHAAGTTDATSTTSTTTATPTSTTSDLTTSSTPGTSDPSTTVGSGDPTSSSGGIPLEPFSFFVTSLRAMQELSGSQDGFGGDLRFGEDGPGAGLRGADKICAAIAEESMPGAAAKGWRAFLSVNADENGQPVHAIERVGPGPWYDRLGRLVAMSPADLANERPQGGDPAIVDDLPNEDGVPNHQPDLVMDPVDNHDTLTGSDKSGHVVSATGTCDDWTSAAPDPQKRPRVGHSWPRSPTNGRHWISEHDAGGCAPGVNLFGMGGPQPGDYSVGAGGGYGGIYCFALTP